MPKVSIIVPVYNVEKYIDKCLESLVNQTLEDIEIIIVNDGSTDSSKEKCIFYANEYLFKVRYFEKENGGLSDARNFGIQKATGKYIAFLDSDDYIENNAYEKMYQKAEEEKSDMVECNFIWEYPNSKKKDILKKYKDKKDMIKRGRVVAWNKLIKTEIIKKNDIEFPKGLIYEDIEFFYKLIPYINKISLVNNCFVHYVQRKNSISNKQTEKIRDIFKVLDNVFEYYKSMNLYDEYKEELEYMYIRILLCSSSKRIRDIKDKEMKNDLLKETIERLESNIPNWRENKILQKEKNLKNFYMRRLAKKRK